tara:strand:- start:101 stop:214 length:114 start_codon:yes stop_codon:yes gene_type:complete
MNVCANASAVVLITFFMFVGLFNKLFTTPQAQLRAYD